MVRYCAAKTCNHSDKNNGLRFFKAPKDETNSTSFQNWQSVAKCPLGKFSLFCSDQFDDSDYVGSSKARLKSNVVPKIRFELASRGDQYASCMSDKVTHEVNVLLAKEQTSFFVQLGENVLKINLAFNTTVAHMQPYFTAKRSVKPHSKPPASTSGSCKYLKRLGSVQHRQKGTLPRLTQTFWKKAYNEAMKNRRNNYVHKRRVSKQVRMAKKQVKDFYIQRMNSCFTKSQINRIVTGKSSGIKWDSQDIALGIRIRYSAHPYNDLRKMGYPLPCPSTLCSYLQQIKFKPGLLEPILEIIKQRFKDATPFEKQSILMFYEMGIDPKYEYFDQGDQYLGGRKNITVFLVRGLFAPWKQIFAFDFCEKLTKSRFMHYVAKLEDAGLIIRSVVCDMGPRNQSLWKSLGIGISETDGVIKVHNYIRSPKNNTKISFKADVPHLIKLLRNHTFASGISIDGSSSLFKKDFHHLIRAEFPNEIKQLFKLTEKHLELSNHEKMKVGPALHVFSFKTAAAWSHHFPERTVEQAFIKLMRNTFNCLTSRTPKLNFQDAAPFGLYLEKQTKLLEEAFDAIAKLRVVGHRSRLPFQNGWLLSIKSTIDDYVELHEDPMNVSYLNTGRSTQDALENVFSCLRAYGQNRNPSAVEIIRRVRLHTISSAPRISTKVSSMIDQDDVALLSSEMLNELTKVTAYCEQDESMSEDKQSVEDSNSIADEAGHCDMAEANGIIDAQTTIRTENQVLEDEEFDYVLGYVAKKLSCKFPELTATREEHDEVPNHWINKLHKYRANVTLPSKIWKTMGTKLNNEFLKLHGIGSRISMSVGVHKDFCKKLQMKYPEIPKKAIDIFMKTREKIRVDNINYKLQQKLIQSHNIEKERIARLQRMASEPQHTLLNREGTVATDESEYEQNESLNHTLFNCDLFSWSIDVNKAAELLLGVSKIRDSQKIAINASLTGLDVIANLPTGSGKSAIFQIAALATPGFAVVVSPLISLIQDQVSFLTEKVIPVISLFNESGNESVELGETITHLQNQSLRFVCVTPEKLVRSKSLQQFLTNAVSNTSWPFKLFVIDEAHCYSDWGKSFRKDYLGLANLKTHWRDVSFIAMSATLTLSTIEELQSDLKMNNTVILRDSVHRPNLKFSVVYCESDKEVRIYEFLQSRQLQSGIIYCQTVVDCERLCEKLSGFGISCVTFEGSLHEIAKNLRI